VPQNVAMTKIDTELDHLFLFVPSELCAREMMATAGLRVSYARVHKGQGTRNLCASLDDIFLELLWLDGSDISTESDKITLAARGRGEGSPIGVSWRGECELDCVEYAAPFLPAGVTIPVARASLDPELPFVFRTPGGTRPINRTDGLVGNRQSPELTVLGHCEILVPNPESVAVLLKSFDRVTVREGTPSFNLSLLDANGRAGREFTWKTALAT
jgi:Glyoxalase-like domain